MTASSARKSFFNLHITGLGYLNRIREIPPKKGKRGEPFMACTIAALNGPSDSPDYCYFDAKVSGRDAQHLVRRCREAVEAKHKVLIGFRLGDPWIDQFTYEKGPKTGQAGASFKARLLFINWIKIDGEEFYKAEAKAADEAANAEGPVTSEPDDTSEDAEAEPPLAQAS